MQPEAAEMRVEHPRNGGGKVRLLTLQDLDSRTRACKHALGLRDGILNDLGGETETSCAQQELAQRASVLGAMLEDAEARYLRGEPVEPGEYCTLANAQRRLLSDLGLERRPRPVPTLKEYFAQRAQVRDTAAQGGQVA